MTVWECLPPYAGVVGGEGQSLAPLLSRNYTMLLGHKDFLIPPVIHKPVPYYFDQFYDQFGWHNNETRQTQWQQSSVVLAYDNKWSSLTFVVWKIMTNSDKYN